MYVYKCSVSKNVRINLLQIFKINIFTKHFNVNNLLHYFYETAEDDIALLSTQMQIFKRT